MRRLLAALLLVPTLALTLAALSASAQAAPNTSLALISYGALKNRVKPQGELAVQIAGIDSAIRIAQRRGQTSEVRRLVAKGTALLNGRQWTGVDDYRQSLVLRADHVFVDPEYVTLSGAKGLYEVRLEQTYAPSIEGLVNLKATASIQAGAIASPAPGAPTPARRTLKQLEDVPRDLRDSPLRMELDLSGAPDGDYVVEVMVSDSARACTERSECELGAARIRISVVSRLAQRLKSLDSAAASAPADLRADIRYPGDYVRKIDRGVIPMGAFDLVSELANAEAVTLSEAKGLSRFAKRTGGFERHYLLEAAGEIMPYRVFVPSTYDGTKPMPLIIALHGAGGTEDGFMDNYERRLPQLAEQRGYIVATPLGYRVTAGYGSPIMGAPARDVALSEQDVMQVLARMRADYKVDDRRIYLMGHSMGGIGTWHLGAKYPEIWAALGSFSGMGFPASESRMKSIPQFVVHGDADNTVPVQRSRDMVAEMQKLGVDYKYIEVPGGNHNDVVVPNLAALFDFFDGRRRFVP